MIVILETKENEIKVLQIKLEAMNKEHESCNNKADSTQDHIKSKNLEHEASEMLLEKEDDDYCQIVELSSVPETKTDDKKRKTNRLRSSVKQFSYQMKSSVQVELNICFLNNYST